jgi:hypothetical protein
LGGAAVAEMWRMEEGKTFLPGRLPKLLEDVVLQQLVPISLSETAVLDD